VNGAALATDFEVVSPTKVSKLPTSLLQGEEKTVIDEKTVCYVSKFDLQLKGWVQEFRAVDSLRQNVLDTLGKLFLF
jgi:hypothetical protein